MAKKKRGKKARSKKAKIAPVVQQKFISRKIRLTLTSLLFTLVIFVGSWIGYEYLFLNSEFFGNFFFVLAYLSGFLSVAFFIALLVFLVLKAFRR
jgi:hypothetical protein